MFRNVTLKCLTEIGKWRKVLHRLKEKKTENFGIKGTYSQSASTIFATIEIIDIA